MRASDSKLSGAPGNAASEDSKTQTDDERKEQAEDGAGDDGANPATNVCQNCDQPQKQASVRCVQCPGLLCDTCNSEIHKFKLSQTHTRIALPVPGAKVQISMQVNVSSLSATNLPVLDFSILAGSTTKQAFAEFVRIVLAERDRKDTSEKAETKDREIQDSKDRGSRERTADSTWLFSFGLCLLRAD